MFSKVIKHDFISTGRIMGIIYIIVAGISAVTLISHYAKKAGEMTIAEMLGVSVLVLVSTCLFILTVVVVLTGFQKTLYGEQGYLTFTLPVKSWMILGSKVLVSTVWFVVALAAFFGSMWVTVVVLKEEVLGENYDLIMSVLSQFSTVNVSAVVVSVVIRMILYFVQFAFFTITVFFTSTIANTRYFQKRSTLWPIVSLFFIDGNLSLVTDSAEYTRLMLNGSSPIDIASIFVYLIVGAGIFYATHYIMSKKVNIR